MVKRNAKRRSGTVPARLRYGNPNPNPRGSLAVSSKVASSVERICALSNPFCASAKGARIPDDDAAPSMGVQIVQRYHFGTDANGKAAFQLRPGLTACTGTAATITGDTVTTWAALSSLNDYSNLIASFGQYRIVSLGVRCYTTLAPTNQSGSVRFVTSGDNLSDGVDMETSFWNETHAAPVAGLDHRWIAKPQGSEWKNYIALGSHADYTRFALYVSGAPASTTDAFICELYFNLEVTPKLDTVTAGAAKPGEQSDPAALQASSIVHSKHRGHHKPEGFFSKMMGLAKSALIDVASSAMPVAGSALKRMLISPRRQPLAIEYVD